MVKTLYPKGSDIQESAHKKIHNDEKKAQDHEERKNILNKSLKYECKFESNFERKKEQEKYHQLLEKTNDKCSKVLDQQDVENII